MQKISFKLRGLLSLFACVIDGMQTLVHAQDIAPSKDWLTMREMTLDIMPNSPLDFSQIFPDQQIRGRVGLDANGSFVIDGKPERFLCGPMILTPPYGGFPEKSMADRYAKQMRRAGYNLVRFMHVETTLMTGRAGDFDYNPEQLDRFYYFLAALRKEGIYWMIDAMSSENGAYGNVTPHRWVNKYDLKVKVQFDKPSQDHWRKLVKSLYGRVNPYTGKSILNDEALMGMSLVNEGGLQFITHLNKKIPQVIEPTLVMWLKQKYTDENKFKSVWGQPKDVLDKGTLNLPAYNERSDKMDDVLDFYLERQLDTAAWMEAYLREQGYKGLVTSYNNIQTTHMAHSRARLKWVDMHSYHDEVFGFKPGSRIKNISSFDKSLEYVTYAAMARLQNKAFSVSEYGHPFWNEWRRESGIVFPAYAALHDWGAICQHASTAVDVTYEQPSGWKQAIAPYHVGQDPVTHAGEILSALLYRRGDVSSAKETVQIVLPGGDAESTSRYWGIPASISRIALLTKTNVRLTEDAIVRSSEKPFLASFDLRPEGKFASKLRQMTEVIGVSQSDYAGQVVKLLNLSNGSQPEKGVYESSTKQLKADFSARYFSVDAPKTQAVVFDTLNKPIIFGTLQVKKSDQPALVALSSLDGNDLVKSKRMLLIVSSDALNTGQEFIDNERHELKVLGKLPPVLKPLHVELTLSGHQHVKVSALRQSGESYEDIPVHETASGVDITVDLASIKFGPTFMFYIKNLD